ncbi:GTP 3',8-cyclase MoaA [Williamsia sp. CHRR-6]|uniref:GTP 3',8-cyclase MoaA n=1 Tax=Williamsia sp. CHRR-6 TaxID=2835871 RepID=UPI001BDB4FE3|nr:GTP 3',8-cyclase MoaA [Williamsia sp. CHRR-6]MBT0566394.1 GTP 3',8-cyclase MoaA [Williamsia sp. CHRR-6]
MTVTGLGIPGLASSTTSVAGMPETGPMVDTFGRVTRDLRVSLTDRCNLRCTYCMPAQGLDWLDDAAVLTTDEMIRLIGIGVSALGIRAVRFTGGEPLLRKDITQIIAAAAALHPRPELALTTNGLGLDKHAGALAAAGLNRVNVSLDTLDRDRFAAITRRDRIADVLLGLDAAAEAGLTPVKVNAVLAPDGGLDDAVALLRMCLDRGFALRIIEQMPLDADHRWSRADMITADQVYARLSAEFDLRPDSVPRGAAPAQTWVVGGHTAPGRDGTHVPARVGIIASVTRPFCGDCDRTRLTADGQLRTCLFSSTETDLRALLRSGVDDDTIAQAWRRATWGKLPGHAINDPSFLQPTRPMSAIGG